MKTTAPGEQRKRPQPSLLFIWLAPFVYAAFALLTPAFQTPDEHQHLFRAWQLSQFELIGERRGDEAGGMLPAGLGRAAQAEIGTIEPHTKSARPIPKRPFGTLFDKGTAPAGVTPPQFYNFLGSVIYSPAGYIPQIGAIWLGNAVGLSVEAIVRLGRLFNGALAILLIHYAIRLSPVGKLALFWVGLLPMTGAASASFGQDGLAIGGACLLTAMGLRIVADGVRGRRDIVLATLLAIALALSKPLYLPLTMISGLPVAGPKLAWRRLLEPVLIGIVAAILSALWLRGVAELVVPISEVPPAASRIEAWVDRPLEFAALLGRTYAGQGIWLSLSLFNFGWLNVGPVLLAALLSFVACGFVLLAGNTASFRIGLPIRLWLATIGISIVVLLSIATYLYWTPANETSILGLQGRYFIPVIPLMVIAFLPNRAGARDYTGLVGALMLGANYLVLAAVVNAFYL